MATILRRYVLRKNERPGGHPPCVEYGLVSSSAGAKYSRINCT